MNITERLNLIFDTNKAYSVNQLVTMLGLKPQDRSLLRQTLNGMDIVFDNGKYGSYAAFGGVRGVLQCTRNDYNFVIPADGSEDIFVPDEYTFGAMHGDTVICKPFFDHDKESKARDKDKHGRVAGRAKKGHTKGKIIKIESRANKTIVGECVFQGDRVYVIPSNARIKRPVLLCGKGVFKAVRPYELVTCDIITYTEKGPLIGELTEVLGLDGEKGVDIKSIVRQYGLPDEFPSEVLLLAEQIEQKGVDARGREDLRDKLIFTMDGEDAKDLDDAVSIERNEQGYLLGVHIADVSHYVRPDSLLDAEARKRGTSVYFPGMVIPMLPKALSNGICSLSQGVDRLCLSVEMTVDKNGKTVKSRIFRSVIKSRYRLTYNGAAQMLEDKKGDPELIEALENARELAKLLQKRRSDSGALDFELPEPQFTLDENNNVVALAARERLVTHKIIEQFMLAANTTVACFMLENSLPALFRVHEKPDSKKLEELGQILKPLGYSIESEEPTPASCRALLTNVKGERYEKLISTLLLRSMKKAKYDSENIGHFGLAEDNYLHFTSPIRRYPDLVVHRILHFYFDQNQKGIALYRREMDRLATLTSERELAAADAERDADDMKKAEFALGLIGQSFDGVISGMNRSVMWVELENTIECVIPRQNMDDAYTFDENLLVLRGKRNNALLRMGDSVSITITDANTAERRVEAAMNGKKRVARSKKDQKSVSDKRAQDKKTSIDKGAIKGKGKKSNKAKIKRKVKAKIKRKR